MSERTPKSPKSHRLRTGLFIAGLAASSAGAIAYTSNHEPKPLHPVAAAPEGAAPYSETETIAALKESLEAGRPVTLLNGSMTEEVVRDGQRATHVMSNPIAVLYPNDTSTEHSHFWTYFEATVTDGVATVTPIEGADDMDIHYPASNELPYFDAVLKPAVENTGVTSDYTIDHVTSPDFTLDFRDSFVAVDSYMIPGK